MFHRVGFASSLDAEDIHALHRAPLIFTRDPEPPARRGRSKVESVAVPVASFFLTGCGVRFLYGTDDAKIASAMRRRPCSRLVIITHTKLRKSSPIQPLVPILERNGAEVTFLVIKKTGDLYAYDFAAGGKMSKAEITAPPPHPTSAPSAPSGSAHARGSTS